jgi:uncharacterized protein
MVRPTVRVQVAESLRFLLALRHRRDDVTVAIDEVSSLGHVVESLGVPRTEIGALLVDGRVAAPGDQPRHGAVIEVQPVHRPQRVADPRFVADVHLGTLARRLRLLGLDVAYRNDAADDELVAQAVEQGRILLTQDRGLLRRRALPAGAYVRGSRPDDQLRDVLERFDPPLDPWSRCLACNGLLEAVDRRLVRHLLEEGTRRSYTQFSRCRECGRPYWRGAHARRLEAIVAAATGGPITR